MFYANQFDTPAKVDITYSIGAGAEQDVLVGYSPTGSNVNVTEKTVDFIDFTTDQNVTFTYYLYNNSAENNGVRFDDVALHSVDSSENDARIFFRVRHVLLD